jgi:hypothetical protein
VFFFPWIFIEAQKQKQKHCETISIGFEILFPSILWLVGI